MCTLIRQQLGQELLDLLSDASVAKGHVDKTV